MLVFEKPQAGVRINTDGMSIEEQIRHIAEINDTLPVSPWDINLGCGAERENVDVEHVCFAAHFLVGVKAGETIPSWIITLAQNSGAWFYWRYAIALVRKELNETVGEDAATEIMYGHDREQFSRMRADRMRWVIRERFGREV